MTISTHAKKKSTSGDSGSFTGLIHQGDCIAGMKGVPDGAIDLVFADPPFNIGYEYDEYDDRLESERYVDWCKQWMEQVHRVLKNDGTFWLAIGDEYAAELKLAAQSIGFVCRSWVIWYYTFGVNCKSKFTRSHAHLFYFVKDPKQYTFNRHAIAVPSARQLVYNDRRGNPEGRLPDDTWILRPQDCADGLTPDEDTWYFPRVAGTFKERAGFHGCQMPEQLLGRIIKACSNPNEVVLDPFSGSATTLAVAKKLERSFVGFELSKEYAQRGAERLAKIFPGDPLDGAEEPKVSAPSTQEKRQSKSGRKSKASAELFPTESKGPERDSAIDVELFLEAFSEASQGYSADRIVADPTLNQKFQASCDARAIRCTEGERNRLLLRIRKRGLLSGINHPVQLRTEMGQEEFDSILFASEIAWRRTSQQFGDCGLDEVLCEPLRVAEFDRIANILMPQSSVLSLRWAAIRLRKEAHLGKKRAENRSPEQLDLGRPSNQDMSVDKLDLSLVPSAPGVYAIRLVDSQYLYVGETDNLRARLERQLASVTSWEQIEPLEFRNMTIEWKPIPKLADGRLARQIIWQRLYRPAWNLEF